LSSCPAAALTLAVCCSISPNLGPNINTWLQSLDYFHGDLRPETILLDESEYLGILSYTVGLSCQSG
jgi:hypothetical protein